MLMRQDERPLISVLMGVLYRRKSLDLLERSIRSIQSQTYSNWELLICDDGSTEAARQYLGEISAKDERVRLIRGCKKTDLASKLNWCLSKAKGSYIARMDDDDIARLDRFEKQIAYLKQHPGISIVGSNVTLRQNGKVIGTRQLPEQPKVQDFLFVQPFIHPSLMFRREVLTEVNGYSENKHCQKCEDYDLLLRLYEHGYQGANLQECLLDYTISTAAKGSRTMCDRLHETVTRFRRFRNLNLLPGAWPYVVKPMAVGMLPSPILSRLKEFFKAES